MFKRIALTLDGSVLSEQAVPTALTLCRQFDSELILLNVVSPLAKTRRAGAASLAAIEAAETALIEEATNYLEGTAARIRENGLAVQVETRFGNPSKSIIEFVNGNEIDLVVMCSRGQTGPARWLLGSVVDHVVRGSAVPVVVVPAQVETASQ
jgi:nucleotide-binding universal stress UspA family protein